MGYPRRACAEALKQANNRLEEAGEMLLTNIDTLIAASQATRDDNHNDDGDQETELMEDGTHIPQLIALGAEFEEARALLDIHGNRLDRAVEELLQKLSNPIVTNTEQDSMGNLIERARTVVEKRGKKKKIFIFAN
jgi:hypothetical protein